MKAQSRSISLFHFAAGHHREINYWHDFDHRPEVVGTVSHIFYSQRWVAPPEYVAVRPATELPNGGGEYAFVYWSSDTPERINYDWDVLGRRLTALGCMRHGAVGNRAV